MAQTRHALLRIRPTSSVSNGRSDRGKAMKHAIIFLVGCLLAGCASAPSANVLLEPCEPNITFWRLAWSPDGETILVNAEYQHNGEMTTRLATIRADGAG